jgi:hypothetical protein
MIPASSSTGMLNDSKVICFELAGVDVAIGRISKTLRYVNSGSVSGLL